MSSSFNKIFRISTIFGKNNTCSTLVNSSKKYYVNALVPFNQERNIHICCAFAAKVKFKLSDIGEGIREVIVKEWYVKVGDKVNQFDNICEVQSDKASATITSRYDGTVSKLYYNVDDIALVGEPLVDVETDQADDGPLELTPTKGKAIEREEIEETENDALKTYLFKSEVADVLETAVDQELVLCVPSVRRLAKEHKINLSSVKGTGKHGRILKEDVLAYLTKEPEEKIQIHKEKEQKISSLNDEIQTIKGFQKVMVKTMTESAKIPIFVYSDEIKVTKLSELRKSLKDLPELKDIKLSFMPFFIKAVSNALQRYSILNASVDENCENINYHKNHNIGIAMDTKAGLAVPVIKAVENLSIVDITKELNRLIQSGKEGSFLPNDMTEGTFAISNIGAIGGSYMKPLILPPNVAIIALGASQVLPRFDDGKNVVAEEIVNFSGAADHRIIDGATMARFTQSLKRQIENPHLLFLNM